MTIKYCDYTSGDDTTGDGSAGNPYKTIDKASTGLTGGDEVRCAKSADPSSLSGTLTWTDGSTSVSTSQDLTGSLSQGYFVGKGVDLWDWWEIDSINSTTITLYKAFSGTSEAVASKKLGTTDTGTAASSLAVVQKLNAGGSSRTSKLKVSGGWDLTGPTQDGWTWFQQTGSNRYGYGLQGNLKNHIELEKVGFLRYYYGVNVYGHWWIGDAYGISSGYCNVQVQSDLHRLGTVVSLACFGSVAAGVYISGKCPNIETVISNSCAKYGVHCSQMASEINELTARRNANAGFYSQSYWNHKIGKITAEYNGNHGIYQDAIGLFIGEAILKNNTGWGLYTLAGGPDSTIIGDLDSSGNSSGDVSVHTSWDWGMRPPIRIQRWGGTAHDSRVLGYKGHWIKKNSSEAKGGSGYCLQFDPDDGSYPVEEILGISKIDSVASDITLSVYVKDDASFDGWFEAAIYLLGKRITGWTEWTATTSYVQKTIVASSSDLLLNEYLELRMRVYGSAGNLYVDDFGVS